MSIRKIMIAAALALAAMSGAAMAQEVTLCAGRAGGGYDATMKSIGAELERQGHAVRIVNMGGSEDLLNATSDGTCDFAPAQKDVHYLMSKTGGATKAIPVSLLYNEAITMVCSASSGYDELEDIQEGDQIIVDVIGSGSALTWDTMVSIEKEYGSGSDWSKAQPSYTPLDEAVAAMSLGTAKCAMGVGSLPISWAAEAVQAGATVAWVYDKDLNDLQYNGTSLYEPVRVDRSVYGYKFDTYKVPAVLFRSASFKEPQVDRLVKRVAPAVGAKRNVIK